MFGAPEVSNFVNGPKDVWCGWAKLVTMGVGGLTRGMFQAHVGSKKSCKPWVVAFLGGTLVDTFVEINVVVWHGGGLHQF